MSDIALTVSILALVAVVGLFIGNVKFRGIGLGIGGVLFGGIIVGHFVSQAGMTLSSDMLHVIQEFGLILFVYTIGIQVGPGFFASLRVSGLRLNLFAVLIVIIGGLVTAILHKLFVHQTMPEESYLYALPYNLYKEHGIRRYGAHGTSHFYVTQEAAKMMNKPVEELNIITCHLGNGGSVSAIRNGKCVDTSMGLTPLEGLVISWFIFVKHNGGVSDAEAFLYYRYRHFCRENGGFPRIATSVSLPGKNGCGI